MIDRWRPAAWMAAGLVLTAATVSAQSMDEALEASYPTNLNLLTSAAESAVSEFLLGFNAPPGEILLVVAEGDHEADWFVENLLLERLSEAGYLAYLSAAKPLTTTLPIPGPDVGLADAMRQGNGGADAIGDSLLAVEDSTVADAALDAEPTDADSPEPADPAAEPTLSDPPPQDGPRIRESDAEYVLRFRIAEFGLTYPRNYRKSPFGSRQVQRMATTSIFGHLLYGEREDVMWVGRGDAERIDVVPESKLSLLEGRNFPFAQPDLQTSGLGSLVEPALVTGIVAGLIYLFYTNQN